MGEELFPQPTIPAPALPRDPLLIAAIRDEVIKSLDFRALSKSIIQFIPPSDPQIIYGTCSVDPASIAANSAGTATCTTTDTVLGYRVWVTPPDTMENGLIFQGAALTGDTTITVRLYNATAAAIDGAARTWSWVAIPDYSPSTRGNLIDAWLFPDGNSGLSAAATLVVPPDYTLTSLRFIWSTPATSGNLRWDMIFEEGGPNDAPDVRTFTTAAVSTAANATASTYQFTEVMQNVDMAQILAQNVWKVQWRRLGAAGEDTLTNLVTYFGLLATFV